MERQSLQLGAGSAGGDGVADEGGYRLIAGAEGRAGLHIHQTAQGGLNTKASVELQVTIVLAALGHQDEDLTGLQYDAAAQRAALTALGGTAQNKLTIVEAADYAVLHLNGLTQRRSQRGAQRKVSGGADAQLIRLSTAASSLQEKAVRSVSR